VRLGDAVVLVGEVIEAADQRDDAAVVGVERHQGALRFGNLPELRMAGVVRHHVDDIALAQHLARFLGRGPDPVVVQLLARPRQPVPVDLHRAQGLDVGTRALVGYRGHDRRREIADRRILLDQLVVVRLAVRRQIDVSGRPAPAVAAVVLDEPDAHRAVGGSLQPAIDGRVHLVTGALRARSEALPQLEPRHLRHVGCFHFV
jgi:hypothetical protein